ncbi:helix-turn-helix domain-containing protein [Akkermansia muciniphila]|uniref:helix-turn-helix domain-containing protein n=1 Tax=Akkermansia muciniphila TaxID=239935 RepID=UPI00129E2A15|nr:XRE family transcriptional regulator [Akkermansia muciniphila]
MKRDRSSVPEETLRTLLRQKRIEKGYSQLKLSLLLDNTRTFVSKYESGERYLTFTEVILICQVLGVDPMEVTRIISNRV